MPVRTFVAIEIDDAARDALMQAIGRVSAGAGDIDVKWAGRENLHITMKFLGAVPDEDLAKVCQAVSDAAAESTPLEFFLPGLVCVPPGGNRVRMVWASVAEPTGQMAALAQRLEAALGPMGFAPEHREFSPHITLGRVKNPRGSGLLRPAVQPFAACAFGRQEAVEVVTFASKLTPRGPIYSPLARAKLKG
jgi:2'-5' RNA ligase